MRSWYSFAPDRDTLTVYEDIGAYGVSARSFLSDLKDIKGDSVVVEVNSPGGDVFTGLAIYNGLRASGKYIHTKVLGIAASAASLVVIAGDEIEMPENTMLMVHNPWSFAVGDADELRATADVLDKIGVSLVSTYAKRTGLDEDKVKSLLEAETWLSANEALALGFATKVTPAVPARASFDLDRLPEQVRALFQPRPTVAEQVGQIAAAAGLAEYATLWALDPTLSGLDAVKARVAEAREIKALCLLAKREDLIEPFIRGNKSLAEARSAIFAALADGETEVDTSPKSTSTQFAVRTADIWAARRKHLQRN